MIDSIWVRDRRMCLISRLFCIRAFSWLKLFDSVKFNFVSLYSPVVKLNESIGVFLLSVFSYQGNVSFEVIIERCNAEFFGQVPFSEWVLILEIDSSVRICGFYHWGSRQFLAGPLSRLVLLLFIFFLSCYGGVFLVTRAIVLFSALSVCPLDVGSVRSGFHPLTLKVSPL